MNSFPYLRFSRVVSVFAACALCVSRVTLGLVIGRGIRLRAKEREPCTPWPLYEALPKPRAKRPAAWNGEGLAEPLTGSPERRHRESGRFLDFIRILELRLWIIQVRAQASEHTLDGAE